MSPAMHDRLYRPLSAVSAGSSVRLRDVCAGQKLEARLASLGFVPGATLDVCRNTCHGPLVVQVKGSRLMLGRGMADKIVVE